MANHLLKSKNIYVIFSITLISVMGVASLTPAFPTIAESLHLSKTQVGLLISVFTLPGVFMTPVMGVFNDRFRNLFAGLFDDSKHSFPVSLLPSDFTLRGRSGAEYAKFTNHAG